MRSLYQHPLGLEVHCNTSSIDAWRVFVKQSWLSGLLDRDMRLAKGHNKLGGLVINTYHINHQGRDFLHSPTSLSLPAPPSQWGQKAGDETDENTKKQHATTRYVSLFN